ncbi:MAG: SH3 domain-containing protein [Myxococcota bacterium]
MQSKSTRGTATEAATSPGSSGQEQATDFGSNSSNLAVMTSVRPRARPVRTFADGGGYTYVARSDGAYVITGAPRPSAVGLIVREGKAWQAIHDLYLSIAPVGRRINEPFEPEAETDVVAPDVDATQTQNMPDEPDPGGDEPVVSNEDPSLWERVAEDVKDGVSDVVEFISDWWDTLGTAEAAEQTKESEKEEPAQGPVAESTDPFVVARGQLTFDAEGTEGGAFHTRTAHWPGGASGVTIGRGYDLGHNSEADILRHMESAGIAATDAAKFAGAAGITGRSARAWLNGHKDELPEISPEQQKLLFDIVYGALSQDVERISGNYARVVSEREGGERDDYEIDWDTLHPAIRDLVVDLRYRGDYTPTTRVYVQPLAIANDLNGMADLMANRTRWSSVPRDRFNRRAQYMRAAVEGGATAPLQGDGPVEDDASTDTDVVSEDATEVSTANAGTGYRVNASALNVRRTPSSDTNDNKVGRLRGGALITATGQTDGWIQFVYDGSTAYVSADYMVEVKDGEEQATGGGGLSGANWYDIANANGWANSTDFDDLSSDFGPKAKTFVDGLRASGASVQVTSGLRHPKRAILMHFAWHVAKGTKSTDAANAHCAANGIDIEWNHGNARASRAAAQELVNRFGLVRSASLTSNHMGGDAIDMKITNVPARLTVDGRSFQAGPQGNGVLDEAKVDHIGRELGVIWYGPGDYVHWSKTGR